MKRGFTGQFGELSEANRITVTSVEGRKITSSAGEKSNMKPGFVGFVVRKTRLDTYEYLAMFVILNTFEKASVAYLVAGEPNNVEVGSLVRIK